MLVLLPCQIDQSSVQPYTIINRNNKQKCFFGPAWNSSWAAAGKTWSEIRHAIWRGRRKLKRRDFRPARWAFQLQLASKLNSTPRCGIIVPTSPRSRRWRSEMRDQKSQKWRESGPLQLFVGGNANTGVWGCVDLVFAPVPTCPSPHRHVLPRRH